MFMLSRMLVGNTPPIVYMQPTDSESYQVGEALKLASGKVTLCSGAVAPSHVCVGPIDDNGVVPCVEVQKYMEFETTLGVAPADSATVGVGDKVPAHRRYAGHRHQDRRRGRGHRHRRPDRRFPCDGEVLSEERRYIT